MRGLRQAGLISLNLSLLTHCEMKAATDQPSGLLGGLRPIPHMHSGNMTCYSYCCYWCLCYYGHFDRDLLAQCQVPSRCPGNNSWDPDHYPQLPGAEQMWLGPPKAHLPSRVTPSPSMSKEGEWWDRPSLGPSSWGAGCLHGGCPTPSIRQSLVMCLVDRLCVSPWQVSH